MAWWRRNAITSNSDWLDIQAAIELLRVQLSSANAAAAGKPLTFNLGSVEVEFAVELRAQAAADAKFQFGVAAIGASGTFSSARTHKIKLTLAPDAPGGDFKVSGNQITEIPER